MIAVLRFECFSAEKPPGTTKEKEIRWLQAGTGPQLRSVVMFIILPFEHETCHETAVLQSCLPSLQKGCLTG
jgi:hypothetical protein